MAKKEVLTDLVMRISANTAELKAGLDRAKQQTTQFQKGLGAIKGAIGAAFAATAIIEGTRRMFEFSQEIGSATAKVRELTGLQGDLAEEATATALAISSTYEQEFGEVVKSANVFSRQMGISFTEALDLINTGFAAGADASGEYLNQLKEYPTFFKQMGLSAEQATAFLTQMGNSGIFSDKATDALKEADLALREMTDTTITALSGIDLDVRKIMEGLRSGSLTTFDVMKMVSARMNEIGANSQEMGTAIADIFKGAGEDAGIDFLRNLQNIDLTMEGITANMTDGQRAQLELTNATADLNRVWTGLFGESSVGWTRIKTQITQIAGTALKALVQGTVDLINYFIDLYNESVIFRAAVQSIVVAFKNMWAVVKFLFSRMISAFKDVGAIAAYVLNPKNWTDNFASGLGDLILEAGRNQINEFKDLGQEIGQNYMDGVKAAIRSEKVQAIANPFEGGGGQFGGGGATGTFPGTGSGQRGGGGAAAVPDNVERLTSENSLLSESVGILQSRDEVLASMKGTLMLVNEEMALTNALIKNQDTMWTQAGDNFKTLFADSVVAGLNAIGGAFVSMGQKGEQSIKSYVASFLDGVQSIINSLLAQSIALLIKDGASKGIFGLAAAAVGIGVVKGMFAKIPEFANGVTGFTGGMALVGERGPEIVSLPRGSSVTPAGPSKRFMDAAGGGVPLQINVSGILRGEDIYLSNEEVKRRRGI